MSSLNMGHFLEVMSCVFVVPDLARPGLSPINAAGGILLRDSPQPPLM